jgi:CubicO group peptidase (beta-lactamase class C family)
MSPSLFVLGLLLCSTSCFGQTTPRDLQQDARRNSSVPVLTAAVGPADPKEIEEWMNQFLADYIKNSSAASLGFVLVKDGKILFQKGYGYADAEKKTPVVPSQTLFYAASVSKLVTATAVMQLIEQRKLKLDADVNAYLKHFQIKSNYPAPVTVENLLTHTSGIDDSFILGSVDRPADLVPLGEFFAKNIPQRARPPGEQIVYSNWGMAFAGYLVEAVSGVSFYDYVEQNIFQPLDMVRSSFRRPFPPNLAPSVATAGVGGQPPDKTAVQLYPAESLVSTVTDMGHFIIAHLNEGRFDSKRILSQASVSEMHRQHFTQHVAMPGVAYGFFESYINDRRALFHTGGGGHESLLCLLPEEKLGFYIVYSGELGKDFLPAFMDHYYPASHPFTLPHPSADFAKRAQRFAGLYRPNFIAMTSIEKLVSFIADTPVVSNGDGTMTLRLPPLGYKSVRMVEVEPFLFRGEEGSYVTFRENGNGNIVRMFTSGATKDPTAYDRLQWYASGMLHAGLGIAGFLVFLSFPLVSTAEFVRRHWRKERSEKQPASGKPSLAWRAAMLVSVLVVLAPVPVLAWMLIGDHSRPSQFRGAFHVSSSCLLFASLIGLTLPIFSYAVWRLGDWSRVKRTYYSIVALAALLMIPFLYHWNLLGS